MLEKSTESIVDGEKDQHIDHREHQTGVNTGVKGDKDCITLHYYVHCRTKRYGLDSLSYHGAHLWNLLPNDMKKCEDLDIFKASVRNWNEPMCKCRMCM